jgi:hypothetical protein
MVATEAGIDWQTLAKGAMRRRALFEKLLSFLENTLQKLSKTHCPLDPEAGAQEARLRLYHLVYVEKKVDTTKPPSSIRAFLAHAASQEMAKQQKRLARRGMYGWGRGGQTGKPMRGETRTGARPLVLPLSAGADVANAEVQAISLPWPLPLYARYYSLYGTLEGAAEQLAAQEGLSPAKLEREYRAVVEKIRAERKKYVITASPYPYMCNRVV